VSGRVTVASGRVTSFDCRCTPFIMISANRKVTIGNPAGFLEPFLRCILCWGVRFLHIHVYLALSSSSRLL
jgi:hypothetical protein